MTEEQTFQQLGTVFSSTQHEALVVEQPAKEVTSQKRCYPLWHLYEIYPARIKKKK